MLYFFAMKQCPSHAFFYFICWFCPIPPYSFLFFFFFFTYPFPSLLLLAPSTCFFKLQSKTSYLKRRQKGEKEKEKENIKGS